ncbi:MAG: TlyA family RNA methyltransferase [Spirochaetaceae bacterium]|nr:TlyA family RNA methyltransferase [Spirochaetaceae bacterium]MCF7946952.1 TlyA family RNA methyltransferase [Spirochaetia bacterium]MCF7951522.1 TlyA family RNA methyltransferase [Spirochaetaceae bacterium]
MKKMPLLQLLHHKFPQFSRKALYARILCGEVAVNGEHHRDPQFKVPLDSEIRFEQRKYVSRGGLKLEAALTMWQLPVEGKVFLDAGASTGGFTDCLLQYGAQKVHAVDVGYNQIDYSLRKDPRVRVLERTNIMHVQELSPPPHAAVADLSFRSLRGAAAHIISLTTEQWMVGLLKPQFEAASEQLEAFNGVVRAEEDAYRILQEVTDYLKEEGLQVRAVVPSPVSGRKGNREFLLLLTGGRCDIFAGERFSDKDSFTR